MSPSVSGNNNAAQSLQLWYPYLIVAFVVADYIVEVQDSRTWTGMTLKEPAQVYYPRLAKRSIEHQFQAADLTELM